MRKAGIVKLGLLLVISACSSGNIMKIESGERIESVEASFGEVFSGDYLVHIPTNFKEGQTYPLILFLHGAGERGDDLEKVKVHGPPKIAEIQDDFPFIVVSPQVPLKERWDADYLMILLDDVERKFPIDQDRIYLTGLSMGGYGTWDLGSKHPERFAAIVPICGGGNVDAACNLKDTPTWVFHGAKDKVVMLSASVEMVQAMEKCGGVPKFTVYDEAGHDSWTESYNNPELYVWLLRQSKSAN